MALLVGIYYYPQGSNLQKNNRKIEFFRSEIDNQLYAKVSALNKDNNYIVLSKIPSDRIIVEMQALIMRVELFKDRINKKFSSETSINTFSIEKQDEILKSLFPNGEKIVSVITSEMSYCPFEIPKSIKISTSPVCLK